MKVLQTIALLVLMSIVSHVYAETTIRFVDLYPPADTDLPIRDDASGRVTIGVGDQANPNAHYNRYEVAIGLDFSRLHCLGPYDTAAGDYLYALWFNGHRLLTFNTNCNYNLPGYIGGDFSTELRFFLDQGHLDGWLDDPVNDEIYVEVFVLSHQWYFADPPPDDVYLVLEGWLTD